MSALFQTTQIRRSGDRTSNLKYALEDLSQLPYPVSKNETRPLQHFLNSTYTDAFVVLQDGVVITEQYFENMSQQTPHLLNSVSKSFVGMLAGIAVDDGALAADHLVSTYVPQLADSAFQYTTLQTALDMTAAVEYSEDYDQRTDDFWHEAAVVGWRPDLQTDTSPRSLLDYCQRRSHTEQGEGAPFTTARC